MIVEKFHLKLVDEIHHPDHRFGIDSRCIEPSLVVAAYDCSSLQILPLKWKNLLQNDDPCVFLVLVVVIRLTVHE